MSTYKNTPRHFETKHLLSNLKARSVRGGAVTIVTQTARFILQMGSTAVLARLLTPDSFGLISMVVVVIRLASMFGDAGLSTAIIQRLEINHVQVSTLFWISFALGTGLMLLVAISSPVIAWFYDDSRLIGITLVLSIDILLSALTIQHKALLTRHMRFFALGVIEITSLAIGVVTGIILAFLGAGYWSLVAMLIVENLAHTLFIWFALRWYPGLPKRGTGIVPMLTFGRNLTGSRFLNFFTRNTDNILIGRLWGANQLGLYAKAYNLVFLPEIIIGDPLSRVVTPALSRLQDDKQRFREYYVKALSAVTMTSMPISVFMFMTADLLIHVWLGTQWNDAVPIFQALGAAGFLSSMNCATGWVLFPLGLTRKQLIWMLIETPIMILAFVIGLKWGAVGVAASFSISQVLMRLPALRYALKDTHIRLIDVGHAIWRPALASLLAAGITFLLMSNIFFELLHLQFISLLISAIIYGLVYIGIWFILPGGYSILIDILGLFTHLRNNPEQVERQ